MTRRTIPAALAIALVPLALRLLLLPVFPAPEPRVHDEFSHLLVADTFAQGRLANPVHPLWRHFESMHILVRPVYASAFPVAQGLVLGAAQALTGRPWLGVWFSCGLMCAAIYWMLRGWVSPGWSLLGAALAAARWGVLSYWMNSYYGGAVPAAAGALVLGALPRLLRTGRTRDGLVFGAGLAILANSRPYEGLLFGVLCTVALLARPKCRRALVPIVLVLAPVAGGMMLYFHAVTGSPARLPYSLYREATTRAPHFLWQSPRPEKTWHHRVLRDFYDHREMVVYRAARAGEIPYGLLDKLKDYGRFYCGPALALGFLALPWMWRNRRTRYLLLAGACMAVGLAVEVWHSPHYAAPAAGLAILISVQALRQVRLHRYGRWAVPALTLAAFATPVLPPVENGRPRADVLRQLESRPGRHLAVVRYSRTHDAGDEWVYNHAAIDASRVVWAREMDPVGNRELMDYYSNRRVWLVEPDAVPPRVRPYPLDLSPDPPFAFVPLGEDAVTVLRSPEEVKRKVLSLAGGAARLTCDQWNFYFTAATAVEAPQGSGCWTAQRAQPVSFDHWFTWLGNQR